MAYIEVVKRLCIVILLSLPEVFIGQTLEVNLSANDLFYAQPKVDDLGRVNQYKCDMRPGVGVVFTYPYSEKLHGRIQLNYFSFQGQIRTGSAHRAGSRIADIDFQKDVLNLRWAPIFLNTPSFELEIGFEQNLTMFLRAQGDIGGTRYYYEYQAWSPYSEEVEIDKSIGRYFLGGYLRINVPVDLSDKHALNLFADWSVRAKGEWANIGSTRKGMAVGLGVGFRWKRLVSEKLNS